MIVASFRVQGIQEITGGGALVLGDVLTGTLRVGLKTVPLKFSDGKLRALEIKSLDFADRRSTGEFWIVLGFEEKNSKSELEWALPNNTVLEFEESEPI
ncbi:MAG: hypothetical protein SFU83_23075 [Meiothermus sp.]|nr:hypothetical protein [Meiothermus sp.]